MTTPRPKEATWATAKLYRVDLYNVKWPRSGTRLVWAVEWIKFRMRRDEWDSIPHELFVKEETDESLDV